jgi:collagenase-like PrtC family protease
MKLALPWNHDARLLDALAPYAAFVDSMYLPFHPSVALSGRDWAGPDAINDYRREIALVCARLAAWSAGLTLVANLPGAPVDVRAVVDEALRFADVVPRVRIKLGDPEVARAVAQLVPASIEIGVSCLANVATAQQAFYWKELAGARYVAVAREINRLPSALAAIKAVGLTVGIVPYDGCIPQCPFSLSHLTRGRVDRGVDGCVDRHTLRLDSRCFAAVRALRARQPTILASKEVLPGHLQHLVGLVDEIKLPGREQPTERIVSDLRQYLQATSLAHPHGAYVEPAEAWEHLLTCDRRCFACSYCADHLQLGATEQSSRETDPRPGGRERGPRSAREPVVGAAVVASPAGEGPSLPLAPPGTVDAAARPRVDPAIAALQRSLQALLARCAPVAFAGFRVAAVAVPPGAPAVAVSLVAAERPAAATRTGSARPGRERLLIEIAPAQGRERRCFRRIRGVAVSYRQATPLDSAPRRAAMAAFVEFLSRHAGWDEAP